MKLQILVPHYKEPVGVIRPLLDSLLVQQNIDFDQFGVIIAHDGPESKDFTLTDNVNLCDPDTWNLPDIYPFEIKQVRQDHLGVSAARNTALDAAKAEYVMFCDCDDMFSNMCGLFIIFREIDNGGFNSFVSAFIEESRLPGTNQVMYINHEMDSTFVHGKVHRRQYLIDNNIRWNPDLTIHEDSYFNCLCQKLTEEVKYCPTPFYLWKWRDESVCRHDPKYILKTYNNMLDSNTALVQQFVRRRRMNDAAFYVVAMVFDAYYTMNKKEWIDQDNHEYRVMTERRFAEYYKTFKDIFDSVKEEDKMQIVAGIRQRMFGEGLMLESITFKDWIDWIEKEYK